MKSVKLKILIEVCAYDTFLYFIHKSHYVLLQYIPRLSKIIRKITLDMRKE